MPNPPFYIADGICGEPLGDGIEPTPGYELVEDPADHSGRRLVDCKRMQYGCKTAGTAYAGSNPTGSRLAATPGASTAGATWRGERVDLPPVRQERRDKAINPRTCTPFASDRATKAWSHF
jgi:hypothetical protein